MLDDINKEQLDKMQNGNGFIAALDQSGGSTPKALGLYGVNEDAWSSDEEMFALVHKMRSRIIKSSSFKGENILAAILFENTMDKEIDGIPTADYLWKNKNIVPILKIDKGLAEEINGVQLMKPMPELNTLLNKANSKGIFGTKMRSVIKQYSENGITEIVNQQFLIAKEILSSGLIPIVEPEVDIYCPDKTSAEEKLKSCILENLEKLDSNDLIMLKLTLPEKDNLYLDCIKHPKTLRVVALSGGYSRDEANNRLTKQKGMIASFSRALSEGLSTDQSNEEFEIRLSNSINEICTASIS